MNNDSLTSKIRKLKEELGDKLSILGHHYQTDEVIQFADKKGDSLELAKFAAKSESAEYIVFCGVLFMCQSADILTNDNQKVILPEISAGCYLSDTADLENVQKAWDTITFITDQKIIPITYINSNADLKSFCGKNNGITCTSSNAEKIIRWAFNKGQKVFFFPDQHLGRNASYNLGVRLDEMIVWDPMQPLGGNSEESIQKARVVLWNGFCNVHQFFLPEEIEYWRKEIDCIQIMVHPECMFEVVNKADFAGSTSFIINKINEAPKGSKWAIGTEYNLVMRLKKQHPDLFITSLSTKPRTTICATMSMITLENLHKVLENLTEGNVINQVTVPKEIADSAKVALQRMLDLS